MHNRSLKLQPFIIPSKSFQPMKIFPQLTIRGKWLEQAGFLSDMQVNVIVEPERLVIVPAGRSEI
mgnify:CR=1 FL=1